MNHPKSRLVFDQSLSSFLLFAFLVSASIALAGSPLQDRIDHDLDEGNQVVIHVVVALCDNVNQGIVPVPEHLGNGQDPRSNLYWGAAYGVRTFLPRASGWNMIEATVPDDPRILERIVLVTNLPRGGAEVPVIIVADAWDGSHIQEAIQSYLEMSAGLFPESVTFTHESNPLTVQAGGAAHLLAYVGHNGLMEFSVDDPCPSPEGSQPRGAMVLACMSQYYFQGHLESAGAQPLLLTTGLMAPEAYTLDAAIRAWVAGGTTQAVVEAAAGAYDKYQHCGLRGARRLFWGEP